MAQSNGFHPISLAVSIIVAPFTPMVTDGHLFYLFYAGIGSSQSNVSMMERPRTSSRQRLSQRENSKDSAIEGSVISSVADDDSVDLKFGGLGAPLASVRPSANGAGAFIRASASAPVTGLSGKATEGLAKSVSLTASSAMDK